MKQVAWCYIVISHKVERTLQIKAFSYLGYNVMYEGEDNWNVKIVGFVT